MFKDQSAYEPGSLVTRSGGLWLATAKTAGALGADPSWRLVVKSGHVARWAPIITNLLPEIGEILERRAAGRESLTS